MDGPRPIVTLLCAAALVVAGVVVVGVVGAAQASGRPALTETARSFANALETPGVGTRDLARFLSPGVSPDDPRVRQSLDALRQAFRSGALVTEVRTFGGEGGAQGGETEIVVLSSTRPGTASSSLTFQWTRRGGGSWGFDPVAR